MYPDVATPNPRTPTPAHPKRRRTRAPALSREAIAATALELVDREGLDALSMRRLAGDLDVGTMTLYGYFRDKDELLDAVVEAATETGRRPPQSGEWRELLAGIAHWMRRGLERHPALVELRLRRPIMTPGALRGNEAGMRSLMEAGLSRGEAARAFRSLFLYTFGFVAFSTGGSVADVRAAVAALPPDEYPTLSASVDEMAAVLGGEEQFRCGLEQLLDGIEARLTRAAGAGS